VKRPHATPPAEERLPLTHRLRHWLTAWNPQRHPWWLRLGVALSLTACAVWLRLAMAPPDSGGRFFTLTLAAALCALYGGFRVGMASVLAGMVAVNYLLVPPYNSFAIADPWPVLSLNFWYLFTQFVVVSSIALMQRQTRDLHSAMAEAQRSHQRMLDTFDARKAAEEALRTSESLLLQAQELAQMASWRYDAATRRFTLLGNAQLLQGVQREHFSDQDMIEATHPQDRERVRQAWRDAFLNGEAHEIEFRLRLSGDEWRWVSVCAEFDRDATGRVSSGLGTLLDISAHKRAEQQIHQLNASLEQRIGERTQALLAAYDELESFSYAVAHDLRSPLRIINGFAQALEEDNPALTPDSHQHLQRIREASKKMGELIDGLLKLSQMSRGELQRTPVDLSAMATRQLRELAATSPERQVDWQVQPGLVAMADAALMEALLQNLLHNAWKYSSQTPQARIRFYGRERPGAREFVVEDNGAGFDMQHAHQLFQPFQRLHHAKAFKGLGIGLATARRIVLRHGGELRADSEPGRGARFFFTLTPPLEQQPALRR